MGKVFFPSTFSHNKQKLFVNDTMCKPEVKLHNTALVAKDGKGKNKILSSRDDVFIQTLPSWSRPLLLTWKETKQPALARYAHMVSDTRPPGCSLYNAYMAWSISAATTRTHQATRLGRLAQLGHNNRKIQKWLTTLLASFPLLTSHNELEAVPEVIGNVLSYSPATS